MRSDASGAPSAGSGELFVQPFVTDDYGLIRKLDDVLSDRFAIVTSDDGPQAWLAEPGRNGGNDQPSKPSDSFRVAGTIHDHAHVRPLCHWTSETRSR